jgi:hypothetical protein
MIPAEGSRAVSASPAQAGFYQAKRRAELLFFAILGFCCGKKVRLEWPQRNG